MPNQFWNRKELYELVWSQPMTKVGAQFGVSDVAIAKACRKLKVPVPGRGYWAKKASGETMKQEPLRAAKDLPNVSMPQQGLKKSTPAVHLDDAGEFERIDSLLASTILSPISSEQHCKIPAIANTLKEARKAKEDSRHMLNLPAGCLDIHVTRGSLDRALSIMGSVIATCQALSVAVRIEEHRTSIEYLGERVSFGLIERVKQFELPPGTRGKYDYGPTYAGRPIDYEPTGLLSLEIREYADLRRNWNDSQRRKLEEVVAEFVATLMKTAVVLHRRTEERKQAEMERHRREVDRRQLEIEIRKEQDRVDDLLTMSDNWRRAQTLREFVTACKDVKVGPNASEEEREEFEKWTTWARQQADRLDPLTESPQSILDRVI